jgi:hypothetical protein
MTHACSVRRRMLWFVLSAIPPATSAAKISDGGGWEALDRTTGERATEE